MAEALDLTIPFDSRKEDTKNLSKIENTMKSIEHTLVNWIDFGKNASQKRLRETKKFITDFFMPTVQNFKDRKLKKIKDKLTLFYEKHIMKNKFFSTVVKKLSTIGKRLLSFASNSFWKILSALIGLAIFDPKGKVLKSIINVLGKALTWILKTIAQYLPGLVKNVINIVKNVLPGIIIGFVKNFFPQISNIFRDLAKQLEKDAPVLSWLFKQLSSSFGKDGTLYKFAMMLGKISPALIASILVLGAGVKIFGTVTKLLPLFKGLSTVFSVLLRVLPLLFTAIKGFATFLIANPVVAVIAGVTAAFIALYKYSDKVSKKSGEMIKGIEDMQKSSNIFKSSLGIIIDPFKKFLNSLKGLADWFSFVKKEGWSAGFKKYWNDAKKNISTEISGLKDIPSNLAKGFKENTFNPIKNWFLKKDWFVNLSEKAKKEKEKFNKTTGKWFSDAVGKTKEIFRSVVGNTTNWFSGLFDKAKEDKIKFNKMLSSIGDWFSGLFKNIKKGKLKFDTKIKSIGNWVLGLFNFKNKFNEISKFINSWFKNIYKKIKENINKIRKFTEKGIKNVLGWFKKSIKFIKSWGKNITNNLLKTFTSIIKKLSSILGKILDIILLPFKKLISFFKKESIKGIFDKVKAGFKNIGSFLWGKIETVFGKIFEIISKPFKAIFNPIKALINKLDPLLKFIINTFNSLRDTFSAFISSPWQFLRKPEESQARVLTARIARETGGDVNLEKIIKFAKGDAVKDITPREKVIGQQIKKETGKEGFTGLTEQKTKRIITKVSKIKINDVDDSTKKIGS